MSSFDVSVFATSGRDLQKQTNLIQKIRFFTNKKLYFFVKNIVFLNLHGGNKVWKQFIIYYNNKVMEVVAPGIIF